MTERLINKRFWIILGIILMCSFLMPSQFRKGGISHILLITVPVSALVLAYLYVFFLRNIPSLEKTLIPLLLWPVVYFSMTTVTEIILNMVFDDYEFAISITKGATFLVNLLYYSLITLPVLGLTKIYSFIFPHSKAE